MLQECKIVIDYNTIIGGILKVKENNFVLNHDLKGEGFSINVTTGNHKSNTYRTIASTNPNLGLPSPSIVFVEKFIESLNQGEENRIKDVLVEFTNNSSLRIKPDNTITIRKFKDYWDKEQFREIINAFAKKFVPGIDNPKTATEVSDWVTSILN